MPFGAASSRFIIIFSTSSALVRVGAEPETTPVPKFGSPGFSESVCVRSTAPSGPMYCIVASERSISSAPGAFLPFSSIFPTVSELMAVHVAEMTWTRSVTC